MREKVIDSAKRLGLEVDVRHLPRTSETVAQAAEAVGCGEWRIARSTVFVADGDPVLCVVSGGHPIDPDLLADVLDVVEVRLATPDEVRAATGFPVSGVPPFGHGLPVVLDQALMEHDTVWTAGGDGRCVLEIEPHRLASCTSATVAVVSS